MTAKTLNIKDPEAHKLARTLAQETGATLTHVVTEALRERLASVRRRRSGTTAQDLLTIGGHCAATLKGKPVVPHDILLYDKRGLPR